MRFSRGLKSSPHCLPSPDGRFIATLFPSVLHIREVRTLEPIRAIRLPADFSGPICAFQWADSSRFVLVATRSQIEVFSVQEGGPHASIKNPVQPGTRPAHVTFGAVDTQVCVFFPFGLKLTIFDLVSSRGFEIANPKFFVSSTVSRGFAFRPQTQHLTLLTRTAGKDLITLHSPSTQEVEQSWSPDTLDASGLMWSPDGKWLIVWESPAHGHKILFYTPDGCLVQTWLGPSLPLPENKDFALGTGVRSVAFASNGHHLAVGDSSKCVTVFSMTAVVEALRLQHPLTIFPKDTLQVWQEQISASQTGSSVHAFVKATQDIVPRQIAKDDAEPRSGCGRLYFDSSSSLLATQLDECPSVAWIWDVGVSELRAVILLHADISSLAWHPNLPETLLLKSDGGRNGTMSFVWDPLSQGPQMVDFGKTLSESPAAGKVHVCWLNMDPRDSSPPALFCSNAHACALVCVADAEEGSAPWPETGTVEWTGQSQAAASPFEIVPASHEVPFSGGNDDDDDSSELEDTFIYKR